MFSKHIIDKHKLTFHESIKLGEDLLFYYQYLMCVDQVAVVSTPLYNYRVYSTSTTQNCNSDLPNMMLNFVDLIASNEIEEETQYEYEWKCTIYLHLKLVLNMYFWNKNNLKKINELVNELNKVLENNFIKSALSIVNIRNVASFKYRYSTISYIIKIYLLKKGFIKITFYISKLDGAIYTIKEVMKKYFKRLNIENL